MKSNIRNHSEIKAAQQQQPANTYKRKLSSFLIAALAIAAFGLLNIVHAASPANGALSPNSTQAVTWSGTGVAGASATGENICQEGVNCDSFAITVNGQPGDWAGKQIRVQITWTLPASDYDLYLHRDSATGPALSQSAGGPPTTSEQVIIVPSSSDGTGVFVVHVVYATAQAGDQYKGSATIENAPQPVLPAVQASDVGPTFNYYAAPNGLGTKAGEPSLGVNWQTGKVFLLAGFNALRVTFDDSVSPAAATWEDKSPPSVTSLDPIMFTDHTRAPGDTTPDRTFVSQLTGQDSITFYTDDDGETYSPSQGGGIPSGVDHQTIGAGPYSSTNAPPVHTYPNAIYYCSQELVTAFCARSDDGGATFGPGIPIYTSECTGIHGHVKVAPDGSVYVPNRSCGGFAGVSRSTDNGITWNVKTVPTSSTTGFLVDPSVGIGTNGVGKPAGQTSNTIYLGYQARDGHAHLAVSHNQGDTWVNDSDVAALVGLQNTTFPEVLAGDDNRVAYAFLGTNMSGNYTDPSSFPDTAAWHLYVATSYDGGATYNVADVTTNNPVQRGTICNLGTTACQTNQTTYNVHDRNLLDFMDASIDKKGRVLVGYPDGCVTANCINNQPNSSGHPNDYAALGSIARQSGGRTLFAQYDSPVAPPSSTQIRTTGNTTGSFATATGANTGQTLLGLTYRSSAFDRLTQNGTAMFNSAPANASGTVTNINNLGSFVLASGGTSDNYNGSSFNLVVNFTAPTGITGGQQAQFSTILTGTVVAAGPINSAGVNVHFTNNTQTFVFRGANGNGAFTLTINDVQGLTPNFPKALTGTITNAAQN